MLFGRAQEFAIEAVLEPDPQLGAVQGGHLAGRFCLWIEGTPVGRIEEPSCWFGPFREHLLTRLDRMNDLWDDSLTGLTPEEIFDRLDALLYAAHRHEVVEVDFYSIPDAFERFSFLTNVSEVFDGWKAFLAREPGAPDLRVLVLPPELRDVATHRVPLDSFASAIREFDRWLDGERRRLLPHLF